MRFLSRTMVILPINKLSCSEENKCSGQNMSLIISRICSKDSFWDIYTVPRLLWLRCYQKICVFILTISWKMNLEQIGLSKMSWLEITSVSKWYERLFLSFYERENVSFRIWTCLIMVWIIMIVSYLYFSHCLSRYN